MKGLLAAFLVLCILVLFFYLSEKKHDEPKLVINHNTKQILFFSQESNFDDEASYYDAIIELKKKFPKEIHNMLIISSKDAAKYYDRYHIEQSPAMVVVYQNKVLFSVDGLIPKERIIEPVEQALTQK
ncbi:small peptidoglycan-associated lipoprotein [Cytobacillus sp. Hz8]|uniref:small peptidoglycan-associated lipoprotein n=1 Tax=Cytobacillus sp. Hz8 TaxID=3347168 RepID=UPI0035DDBCD6